MTAERAFWDSSALLLLVTHQRSTPRALAIRRSKPKLVVWWGTRIEVRSGIARLVRARVLDATAGTQALAKLEAIAAAVVEVAPNEPIRVRAERALDDHDLRAADALQLAAALEWCTGRSRGRTFVCFDDRLAEAAQREGFDLRP